VSQISSGQCSALRLGDNPFRYQQAQRQNKYARRKYFWVYFHYIFISLLLFQVFFFFRSDEVSIITFPKMFLDFDDNFQTYGKACANEVFDIQVVSFHAYSLGSIVLALSGYWPHVSPVKIGARLDPRPSAAG